jgi:hypothetical protein
MVIAVKRAARAAVRAGQHQRPTFFVVQLDVGVYATE